jgi:hypothetical protein
MSRCGGYGRTRVRLPGSAVHVAAGLDQRTSPMQPLHEDRYT